MPRRDQVEALRDDAIWITVFPLSGSRDRPQEEWRSRVFCRPRRYRNMPALTLNDCPGLTPEMRRQAERRFWIALCDSLGGEVQAAAAHAESRRIRAKYRPHQVPSDATADYAPVERWNAACQRAMAAAFAPWPKLGQEASIELAFLPTYHVHVRLEALSGFAHDGVRATIDLGDYLVDHDTRFGRNSLVFRDADRRGGDLTVELRDYAELGTFPNDLAGTPLEEDPKRLY